MPPDEFVWGLLLILAVSNNYIGGNFMKNQSKFSTQKIVVLGLLSAIAYLVVLIFRFSFIPSAPFLQYEAKDIIIVIGGLIFGPLTALIIAVVVSTIEFFTISDSGPIGLLMNIVATASFACVPAFIYYRKKTNRRLIIGLILGTVCMTIVMILWNYLITPIYLGVPRNVIVDMIVPVFLPFNLIKGGINAFFTIIIAAPIMQMLKKSKLISDESNYDSKKSNLILTIIFGAFGLITCMYFVLVLNGTIK